MMTVKEPKKWLLLGALVLLTPVFTFAHSPKDSGCGLRKEKCRQVPDGGSAASYLLAVGATCLGAMLVRSRFDKSRVS
jgi:hypothetical protein